MALASVPQVFLIGIPLLALWGLAGPATQAIMTRQVDPHEQCRLQGAVASRASLAGIVGPTIFTQIFALFISDHAPVHLPGAPFLLSSVLLIAGMILAWNVTRSLSRRYAQPAPPTIVPAAMPIGDVPPIGETK